MIENSTNLISKRTGKWTGNEPETNFLIASIVGTEVNMLNMLNMIDMVNMVDQLILLVQLSIVSVTSASDHLYLM